MNCKPGELAIIVKLLDFSENIVDEGLLPGLREAFAMACLGKIVQITTMHNEQAWNIEEAWFHLCHMGQRISFSLLSLEDRVLMPIRGVPVDIDIHDEVPA